jgi:hypothetical protein
MPDDLSNRELADAIDLRRHESQPPLPARACTGQRWTF